MSLWHFKRDTAFRKQFFVPDSFAHPAKMDAQLLIRIVEEYTNPGETILDPMAGSGTTMLACTLGRSVVLVELEEKFCKMMRDNWKEVRMRPQLGSQMGNCQRIQGDARNFEGLADKIITSPPYTNRMDGGGKRSGRAGMTPYSGEANAWPTQRPQDNIGNLPYGDIDKIITSPPFGGAEASDDRKTFNPTHHSIGQGSLKTDHYKRGSIANLPYGNIDSIITSPPYEEGGGHGGKPTKVAIEKRQSSMGQSTDNLYSTRTDNMGNFRGDSYLRAMLQVYQQCYKVLRDKGLMILVVKNFIRKQAEVDLRKDTVKLCEQAGFKFKEEHHRILPAQSFWRIIYKQKYPDAPEIDREYVLAFDKAKI